MSQSQQDRLDQHMLESMSASIRGNMPFSFNTDDMADLLLRMSKRVAPKITEVKKDKT